MAKTRSSKKKAVAKGTSAPKKKKISENFDIASYLDSVTKVDVDVDKSDLQRKALNALDITKKHHNKCSNLCQRFVDELGLIGTHFCCFICFICRQCYYFTNCMFYQVDKNGKKKWGAMLVMVDNPNYVAGVEMEKEIPAAFVVCGGRKTLKKKYLTNSMLKDWLIRMKKINADRVKVPFYKPSAQNQMIRTFFGSMSKNYGWNWSETNFKGFKGSLAGAMQEVYKERRKIYVSKNY